MEAPERVPGLETDTGETRGALANAAIEVWILVGEPCPGVDLAAFFQLGKGEIASGNEAALVQHLVGLAIEEDPPIPRPALGNGTLFADRGGTVGCEHVIPARPGMEVVQRAEILAKPFLGLRGCGQSAIKVNIFTVTINGANPDRISFIGDNINQLGLTIEAGDGGKLLADDFSGFNRETDGGGIGEAKANHRMRHPGRSPVGDGEISAREL